MRCLHPRLVPYPEVVSRQTDGQTDGEHRVVLADHCIIHAHAMAPSSVRMAARPCSIVMGELIRTKAVFHIWNGGLRYIPSTCLVPERSHAQ